MYAKLRRICVVQRSDYGKAKVESWEILLFSKLTDQKILA